MGGEASPAGAIVIDDVQEYIKEPSCTFRCQIGDHPIEDGEEVFIAKHQVGPTVQTEILCGHHRHLVVSLSKLSWRRL